VAEKAKEQDYNMIERNDIATYQSSLLAGNTNPYDPFVAMGAPLGQLVLQPRKSSFSATTLGSTEKIYVGIKADVYDLALWVANQNYSYTIQELPGLNYSITITVPYDEIADTDNRVNERVQWEITPNVVNRDIFDAGIFTTYPNSTLLNDTARYTVPPWVRVVIKEAVKYGVYGHVNFTVNPLNNSTLTPTQLGQLVALQPIASQFLNHLKSGVTSVQSTIIHVKRVAVYSIKDPNAYDANPYYTQILSPAAAQLSNVNPIISRQDLIKYFNPDPVTTAQLLPSYAMPKSLADNQYKDSTTSFALGGYLVGVPIRTFMTPTKVRIEQNFEFDEWLDDLYYRFSPIGDFPSLQPTPYPPNYTGIT
jgi:hypothetical protein